MVGILLTSSVCLLRRSEQIGSTPKLLLFLSIDSIISAGGGLAPPAIDNRRALRDRLRPHYLTILPFQLDQPRCIINGHAGRKPTWTSISAQCTHPCNPSIGIPSLTQAPRCRAPPRAAITRLTTRWLSCSVYFLRSTVTLNSSGGQEPSWDLGLNS